MTGPKDSGKNSTTAKAVAVAEGLKHGPTTVRKFKPIKECKKATVDVEKAKGTLLVNRRPIHLLPRPNKMDNFRIIKTPLITESALKEIEAKNCLVFICDRRATKPQIKAAVTQRFGVKVVKVNTLIRLTGDKKARVRLHKDHDALDIASQMGII